MHRTVKLLTSVLVISLCLSGCMGTSTNDTLALQAGDYVAMLPFESSDTRVKHVGLISDQDIRIEIESGLMDLSKQYFDPSSVGYRTHTFLDFDELDATDGSRGLLGTLRDDNPNGLNPSRDEAFDTGNGEVTGATEKLQNYIEVTAGKLVNYMRERFNDISARIPIYIAAYSLDSSQESLGGYFYEGMFEGSSGSYNSLDEEWILVPSTQLTTDDPTTAEQFNTFKEDIQNVLPDYTYVTGKAKYENGNLVKLQLDITSHGKTAGEILAVCQTANSSLSVFTSTDCEYQITITNDDTVYAMINRDIDSTETNVNTRF